jgi:hypothetical protein
MNTWGLELDFLQVGDGERSGDAIALRYARQARLLPALIVIFPIALLLAVWFPALWTVWDALISLGSSFGIILLLAQIARDRGKQREPELYQMWGGKPSVSLLRSSDSRIDEYTKDRYRAYIRAQLPNTPLPDAAEEARDPTAADRVYESVTTWLLTQTRDTKRFPLLFRENISFGFRRNLWGLKPIGATVALLCASVSTAVSLIFYHASGQGPEPQIVAATGVVWLLALVWIAVINPSWVRIPADA